MESVGVLVSIPCAHLSTINRFSSGTDATIAEHIAKIIEREYVVEKQEARTKYLVPSTLGIGLVDGYNQIGFDRSLTKPHLRREVSSIAFFVIRICGLLTRYERPNTGCN